MSEPEREVQGDAEKQSHKAEGEAEFPHPLLEEGQGHDAIRLHKFDVDRQELGPGEKLPTRAGPSDRRTLQHGERVACVPVVEAHRERAQQWCSPYLIIPCLHLLHHVTSPPLAGPGHTPALQICSIISPRAATPASRVASSGAARQVREAADRRGTRQSPDEGQANGEAKQACHEEHLRRDHAEDHARDEDEHEKSTPNPLVLGADDARVLLLVVAQQADAATHAAVALCTQGNAVAKLTDACLHGHASLDLACIVPVHVLSPETR
mmetsp:Transcript_10876/g.34000  ORF Transcript_10876/g.34000 Transcript_10876/m.34000 type:complete len:267 (+) Transcript_10876:1130-1930(+)